VDFQPEKIKNLICDGSQDLENRTVILKENIELAFSHRIINDHVGLLNSAKYSETNYLEEKAKIQ